MRITATARRMRIAANSDTGSESSTAKEQADRTEERKREATHHPDRITLDSQQHPTSQARIPAMSDSGAPSPPTRELAQLLARRLSATEGTVRITLIFRDGTYVDGYRSVSDRLRPRDLDTGPSTAA
jgi:hypothetical protein